METIYVRNVDKDIKRELKKRAAKRRMSLNEYCKQVFKNESENMIVTDIEQRYLTLVKDTLTAVNKNTSTLKEISERLEVLEAQLVDKNN